VDDPPDPGTPQAYRDRRGQDAQAVADRIRAAGAKALAVEADLADPTTAARLFDLAEDQLGPVDILVNNATGWVKDTFAARDTDRYGRSLKPVSATTWDLQFKVDAMGAALMISEFAQRHIAREARWGRIIGLTSGGDLGFPEEVSYGAAKAAQTNYTMAAAVELAPFGVTRQHGVPPRDRFRLGHRRGPRGSRRAPRPDPRGQPGRGRRRDRLPGLRLRRLDHRQRDHPPIREPKRQHQIWRPRPADAPMTPSANCSDKSS
jgi:NAD(P)-dependent dehydrogenase (short-subunit alcohol dehydrogenase family)